jgi:hypothetical protein
LGRNFEHGHHHVERSFGRGEESADVVRIDMIEQQARIGVVPQIDRDIELRQVQAAEALCQHRVGRALDMRAFLEKFEGDDPVEDSHPFGQP